MLLPAQVGVGWGAPTGVWSCEGAEHPWPGKQLREDLMVVCASMSTQRTAHPPHGAQKVVGTHKSKGKSSLIIIITTIIFF